MVLPGGRRLIFKNLRRDGSHGRRKTDILCIGRSILFLYVNLLVTGYTYICIYMNIDSSKYRREVRLLLIEGDGPLSSSIWYIFKSNINVLLRSFP